MRYRPRDGHRERRSTIDRSWSCPGPEPTPAPACHRRAVCRRRSRSGAALPPTAEQGAHCRRPNRPRSSAPVLHPDAHRSRFADTAADDHSTSRPARAPAAPARPGHARSVGSVLRPARYNRTSCSSAWGAPDVSPRSWPAHTPTLPRHLRLTCAVRPDTPGIPFLSARVCVFVVQDDRAGRKRQLERLWRCSWLSTALSRKRRKARAAAPR